MSQVEVTVKYFVGLVCVNGASIDNLQLDTATDNSVFAVDIGAGNVEAFTWKYDTQTLAGAVAPNSWAGVCGTGTSQSPINIVTANTAPANCQFNFLPLRSIKNVRLLDKYLYIEVFQFIVFRYH